LPFPQPIHATRQIETLLHLRNAATLVARECFLESAEHTGLRRRSTVRQQERGSCRQFFLQMHQDLLNDPYCFHPFDQSILYVLMDLKAVSTALQQSFDR